MDLMDTPPLEAYRYTFDHLAQTLDQFLTQIGATAYILYMQDYGGPVGMRLSTAHPESHQRHPVYPYPYIPQYTGKGDPKDAANYSAVKSPVTTPQMLDNEALGLIGPDNQKSYTVKAGKLVAADGT